jgi:predicted ATP-grasp superfamily ATP-dependent carboligase
MNPLASNHHHPVLLFDGGYYGTLAAARYFGRANVPVTIAESHMLAPARWSRYVTRRMQCPDVGDTERFVAWLLDIGRREPGYVLYPTSDDLAWLFARHRDELAPYFKLFQPGVGTIYALLNKQRLAKACSEAGLDTPQTFFPANDDDLAQIAAKARYPVLIKPQTQILFTNHVKGVQVHNSHELIARYQQFIAANAFGQALLSADPQVVRPMVQAYHPQAAEHIYSISGFVDDQGRLVAVRAARKVLQRPRKLGIGLCFEEADVEPQLCKRLENLCRRVGYYGVFEAEFVRADGQALLIDFNPRFYSQMAFEVARGMPLPLLVYYAACGDEQALQTAIAAAQRWFVAQQHIYCHRFTLALLLRAQRLSGRLSTEEAQQWRRWYVAHREHATDAVADRSDPLPALVDIALHLQSYARHPRAFVRHMVLDQ